MMMTSPPPLIPKKGDDSYPPRSERELVAGVCRVCGWPRPCTCRCARVDQVTGKRCGKPNAMRVRSGSIICADCMTDDPLDELWSA